MQFHSTAEKILKRFFETELYDEMYQEIVHFLSSPHIREGVFEGNEVLIRKLNRDTAIVYLEYLMDNEPSRYSDEAKIIEIPALLEQLRDWKKNNV